MRSRSLWARRGWAALASGVAWAPEAAHACSVCMGGTTDPAQGGFFVSAMVLSSLPVALGGGLALWLRHRARRLSQREQDGFGEIDR